MTKTEEHALRQRVEDLERGFAILGRVVEEIAIAAAATTGHAAEAMSHLAAEQARLASALQPEPSGSGHTFH